MIIIGMGLVGIGACLIRITYIYRRRGDRSGDYCLTHVTIVLPMLCNPPRRDRKVIMSSKLYIAHYSLFRRPVLMKRGMGNLYSDGGGECNLKFKGREEKSKYGLKYLLCVEICMGLLKVAM